VVATAAAVVRCCGIIGSSGLSSRSRSSSISQGLSGVRAVYCDTSVAAAAAICFWRGAGLLVRTRLLVVVLRCASCMSHLYSPANPTCIC
jgi:hypothetical protein